MTELMGNLLHTRSFCTAFGVKIVALKFDVQTKYLLRRGVPFCNICVKYMHPHELPTPPRPRRGTESQESF